MNNMNLPKHALYKDNHAIGEQLYTAKQIAEEIGISTLSLNKQLKELGVQYQTTNGDWLLCFDYRNRGFAKSVSSMGHNKLYLKKALLWTDIGRVFVYELLRSK